MLYKKIGTQAACNYCADVTSTMKLKYSGARVFYFLADAEPWLNFANLLKK